MLARLFQVALYAAPDSFRRAYGAQLRRDFSEALRDEASRRGSLGAALFWLGAVADILWTGIRERVAILARDCGFALRSMRKAPLFTLIVVATLAVAIGANATAFSVLYSVVLAPLPYQHPDRLVAVSGSYRGHGLGLSFPDFEELRAENRSLVSFVAGHGTDGIFAYQRYVRRLVGYSTTPALFDVLQVKPQLGRFLRESDAKQGAASVVVISDRLWRRIFNMSPAVIGARIVLDGHARTIVGVGPPHLQQPSPGDLFFPDYWTVIQPYEPLYQRGGDYYEGTARLRDGVALTTARTDLATIAARLALRYPKTDGGHGVRLTPLIDSVVGTARPFLFAIFAAVVGVLLVACVNVANLLLSRGATRDRELAVRAANGATRGRIAAQLLAECSLFAILGGLGGLVLYAVGINAFVATQPDLPRSSELGFDAVVVWYTFGIVALTAMVAGLAPALLLSQREFAGGLKVAGRGGDASRGGRVRAGLVVAEVAVTLAVVVASSLVVRSFMILTRQPLGFSPSDIVMTDSIELPGRNDFLDAGPNASTAAFYDRLLRHVRAIPEVREASPAVSAPFTETEGNTQFSIVGQLKHGAAKTSIFFEIAGPDYFRALRIPLIQGRSFNARDRFGSRSVVVVNQAFVRAYLPRRSPLGVRIVTPMTVSAASAPPDRTIVGVAHDVRDSYSEPAIPKIYFPYAQLPMSPALLVVRTSPGARVRQAVAAAVQATDPRLPTPEVDELGHYLSDDAARARLGAVTLGTLGLIAFALAMAGIYAVVSYGVTQRTHELGVRMALGARAQRVVRGVIRRAMIPAGLGALLGVMLAAWSAQLVADQLYGIKPFDALTFAVVILAMILAAAAAALVPAVRATRVDPVIALRYE